MVPATLKAASTSMIQRYFMTSSPFEPRGPLLFLFGWETMKVTPQVLCTLKRDVLVAIEAPFARCASSGRCCRQVHHFATRRIILGDNEVEGGKNVAEVRPREGHRLHAGKIKRALRPD